MKQDIIGEPLSRIDGRLKVTGAAKYAAEWDLPGLAHAVAFQSTIGSGRIVSIDTSKAEKLPGVLAIITHENAPKLNKYPSEDSKKKPEDAKTEKGKPGQKLLPLQSDIIYYNGQYVGVVVAETFEQAQYAASQVKVKYTSRRPAMDMEKHKGRAFKAPEEAGRETYEATRGDVQAGLRDADAHIDRTYRTPVENHNPMEISATIAAWQGENLTLYDATQWVEGSQGVAAGMLGVPKENVRVVSPFLGGGFGCKGSVWPHVVLSAIAAKKVGRPVRMELTRRQMFTSVGYRAETEQRIVLGAKKSGALTTVIHETFAQTSPYDEFTEKCGVIAPMLYASPNAHIAHKLIRVNRNTPTQMRAPGEAPGSFALECGMDELAIALGLDPIDLRLRNETAVDPQKKLPFSSRSLKQCYALGAEKFGWNRRKPVPRSTQNGDWLVGLGMAASTYPTNRSGAKAAAQIFADGRARAVSATHDLGTGSYTIFTHIAAEFLGMDVKNVHFELGDTHLPTAPVSGGSQSAASVGSAVRAAASALKRKAIALAIADPASPLYGHSEDQIEVDNGQMFLVSDKSKGETYSSLLRRHNLDTLEAEAESKPGDEKKKYAMHAFGAQFAEVNVNVHSGEVRVVRFVGAFAAGRILNAKTARSQLLGGMVWGIGMALHEHTVDDVRTGRIMNADLSEYHVPVNADVPPIEIYTVEETDSIINPIGAKGIGEIGIVGAAAAIANAVYNATGKRVRELPITPDRVL